MRWSEKSKEEERNRKEGDLTRRRVGFGRRMVVAVRVTHNSLGMEMEKFGDVRKKKEERR